MIHSESVDETKHKVVRCRSRSVSGEKIATLGEEPTPTPTPSPSPGALNQPINSIFLNQVAYPPSDYLPCQNSSHEHLKKVALDEEIDMPPELLVAMIFGPGDSYNSLMQQYGASKMDFSPWEPAIPRINTAAMMRGELPAALEQTSERKGTYRLKLGWSVGPSHADLIETHRILDETRPGIFYMAERETVAPGMPYGDYFFTLWRYCIRRLPAKSPTDKIVRSRVTATGEVRYKKSMWKAFQGIIERNAQTGMDTFMNVLRPALEEECSKYAALVAAGPSTVATSQPIISTPQTPASRQPSTGRKVHPVSVAEEENRPMTPTEPHRPQWHNHQEPPAGGAWSSADNWVSINPAVFSRWLLVAVGVLLLLTLYLAKRVHDIELQLDSWLLRNNEMLFEEAKVAASNPRHLGDVLSRMSEVSGQLSDSLKVFAQVIRNREEGQVIPPLANPSDGSDL